MRFDIYDAAMLFLTLWLVAGIALNEFMDKRKN